MNRFKIVFACLIGLGIVLLSYNLLKPIDVTEENSIHIQSIVTKVDKGGLGDYIVELEDKSGMYFISKADVQNINIERLAKAVDGRRVSVFYLKPKALSLFGPMINRRQITKLEVGENVVFSII